MAESIEESARGARSHSQNPQVAASNPKVLVSVIAPTTTERHAFHEHVLYASFNAQRHAHKELIVVDSGPEPSAFFGDLDDDRVRYIHKTTANSVGAKRNVALRLANGAIVAHFDDDDLYAPTYLTKMLAALKEAQCKFVKLNSWYVHDRTTGCFGYFGYDDYYDCDSGYDALNNNNNKKKKKKKNNNCLLYTSPSPRDRTRSRMPSSA